ncbi:MAG: conjugal transfer protein TrbF [Termitinemataceae bacterium]|nr:MAG: conjugal transfer protein TrbF [Termitinemataceae bacterium]
MSSPHKSSVYNPPEVKNPFEAADKVYHDLIADAHKEKKIWQKIALFSLVFPLISVIVYVKAVTMQRTVPVLVTVSDWGEAKYHGEVTQTLESMTVPDAAIEFQVRDFVSKLRSIPADGQVLFNDVTQLYQMVTAKCATTMTEQLRANAPFDVVGELKRVIEIESVIKLSGGSYQIDWLENNSGTSSNYRQRFRGVITIKLLVPPKDKRINNPLGIYIDDYSYTEIQGVK